MADAFDRIGRIRGSQPQPRQTSNDAQFEAYRAAVNAANQASQQQGPPPGWRQANAAEQFLHGMGQTGLAINDLFGQNEAWAELKNAVFGDEGGVGKALVNWAPRFIASLPTQVASIPFMAPEKLGEAITGSPMQEIQNGYIPNYTMDGEQRLAAFGDVGIDILGLAFGGSGTALRSGRNMLRSMGDETLASSVNAANRWRNGMSSGRRVAWDIAEEGAEEFAQQYLEEIRGDQENHGLEAIDEGTLDRALEGAFLGALGGGIFSGGSLAIEKGLGYAGDRAKKWASDGKSADELAPMDIYTPYIHQTDDDMDGRDLEYLSDEYVRTMKRIDSEEARRAGIETVKFSPLGSNSPGRAQYVPMRKFYESMNARGEEGKAVANSLIDSFNIIEAANAGKLARYGISDEASARSVIANLAMRGGTNHTTLNNIFQEALRFTNDELGRDVEITIAKNPHHNGGLYKLAVDSIRLDGTVMIDAQTVSKLNADADGDDAVLTFLSSIDGYSPRRSILHIDDDTGRSYASLEQLGMHGIDKNFNNAMNPKRFINDIIAKHNAKAEDTASNFMKIEGEQLELVNSAVEELTKAIENADDNAYAVAFNKLIKALMMENEGKSAYNASGDQNLQDDAEMMLSRDLQDFMKLILSRKSLFADILSGTTASESASEATGEEIAERAEKDVETSIGAAIPERVSDKTKVDVISAAKPNVLAPIIDVYHWIRGYTLVLEEDVRINSIFRNMFTLAQQRHSIIQKSVPGGNVIQQMALYAMDIRNLGQEKSDYITNLFNIAVMMEVETRCYNEKNLVVNFRPGMNWDAFEEVFTSVYNEFVDMYNECIEDVLGKEGQKQAPSRTEFIKNRIDKSTGTNVYDAFLAVWGEKILDVGSITNGLSINEFLQYRKRPERSLRTFADEIMPDAEWAPKSEIDMLNKFMDGLERAWFDSRDKVYGAEGSLVRYLGSIGDDSLSYYIEKYTTYGPDSLNQYELATLYEEVLGILNAIQGIVGFDAFWDKSRDALMRTAIDFIKHERFFELMTKSPGGKVNLELGHERLNFLTSLFLQSKFKHEMKAINDAKLSIESADLSTPESRISAIQAAKRHLEYARVSLARSVGSNRFNQLFWSDLTEVRYKKIDALNGESSVVEIRDAFNEVDAWISQMINPFVHIDEKFRLLGLNSIRSGEAHVWIADMLAPSRAIAGDIGMGNRLRRAKSFYSEDIGHLFRSREFAQKQCDRILEELASTGKESRFNSDEFIDIVRDVCDNLDVRDDNVYVASIIDTEILSLSAQEKARSMAGASMLSQSQVYMDGVTRTAYMNTLTGDMNSIPKRSRDAMCSDHHSMARLVFGPRSKKEADEDRWMVGDPLAGIDYTEWNCYLFYRAHLPEMSDQIDAAIKDGYFTPTPTLFVHLVKKFPEIVEMISPKRIGVSVGPDGHYMASSVPVFRNIGSLVDRAVSMRDSVDINDSTDIVWKHVGRLTSAQLFWQTALSTEDRIGKPTDYEDACVVAVKKIKPLIKDMMLHAMMLADRGRTEELDAFKKDVGKQILSVSMQDLRKTMRRQLNIDRKVENNIEQLMQDMMFGISQIAMPIIHDAVNKQAAFTKYLEDTTSEELFSSIEEEGRKANPAELVLGDIISSLESLPENIIDEWYEQFMHRMLYDIKKAAMQQHALNSWVRAFETLFGLDLESMNQRFDIADINKNIRMNIGRILEDYGVVPDNDSVDKIMSVPFMKKLSSKLSDIVIEYEDDVLKELNDEEYASTLKEIGYDPTFETFKNLFIDSDKASVGASENLPDSVKSFFSDAIAHRNRKATPDTRMEYDNLSSSMKKKIEWLQNRIAEYSAPGSTISEKQMADEAESVFNEFQFDIATWTLNVMSDDYNLTQVSTKTTVFARQLLGAIDMMYDTLQDKLTPREREYLKRKPDYNTVSEFKWTVPLNMFDMLSQTHGFTGLNLAARGHVEIMTGVEGDFPKTFASFMFLVDAPNKIIFNNMSWADLLRVSLREVDVPDNVTPMWLASLGENDFFKVDVVLDDNIMSYLGDRKPDGLKAGDIYTLKWDDIVGLYLEAASGKSISSSFQVYGGSPNEITNGMSGFSNEEKLLKAQKEALSIFDVTGLNLPKPGDRIAPEIAGFKNVASSEKMDRLIVQWNDFMDRYARKVIELSRRSSIEEKSPLITQRWVLKHFVPSAKLTLDSAWAASMNIPDTVTISYEQAYRASSRYGNAMFDKLDDSPIMDEAGKLKFVRRDKDGSAIDIIEIPADVVLGASIDIMPADAVSARLIRIGNDLVDEWGSMSQDERGRYNNDVDTYMHRSFASRYIDWSSETFRPMTARDWLHASRPGAGFSEDPASMMHSRSTWNRFLDKVYDANLSQAESEARDRWVEAYDPIWNRENLSTFYDKTKDELFTCMAVITKAPSRNQHEISKDTLRIYNESLAGLYEENASASRKMTSRKLVVSADEFLKSDYLMPSNSGIALSYMPDPATLEKILLKSLTSGSDIYCTKDIEAQLANGIMRVGNGYSRVQPISDPMHPVIDGEQYGYRITSQQIWDAVIASPSMVDAGVIKINNKAFDGSNEDKYKSAEQPRHNVLATIRGRNPFDLADSGVLVTYDMARNLPTHTILRDVVYEDIVRSSSMHESMTEASGDDIEALFDAIPDMTIGKDSIDAKSLSFKSKSGVNYRLDLSGMRGLDMSDYAKICRVAEFEETRKSYSKMKSVMQNQVFTVAKVTMADRTVVLYPIAASDAPAVTDNTIQKIEYRFDSVKVSYEHRFDMLDGVSSVEEWNRTISEDPEWIKLYLLDIFHKGLGEASGGRIDCSVLGRENPVWGLVDGNNSLYSKVADGEDFDRKIAISLIDNLFKLSGHKPSSWDPIGNGTGVSSWVSMDKLPIGVSEMTWYTLMNADLLTRRMASDWYSILEHSEVHFVKPGHEYDATDAKAVRFDQVTRRFIRKMLSAGLNPKILLNPTDANGWWTGLDSCYLEMMFDTIVSLDDVFFFAWYITKDDVRADGKKFCVESSSFLFEDDYNEWANGQFKDYVFDGQMRMWVDVHDVRGMNGHELMHLISTSVANDLPATSLGRLSTKAAISDQIGMATSWQTGKGPFSKWASKLYSNAKGFSRSEALGMLSKYSHNGATRNDISSGDEEGLLWVVPDNAPKINMSDYVDPSSIEIPFIVTREWIPSSVKDELGTFDEMAEMYQVVPTVYKAWTGGSDTGKIENAVELKNRHFGEMKRALGAKNITWHEMCLLVEFVIGWTPGPMPGIDGDMRPIPGSDFKHGVDKIIERSNTDSGRILSVERLYSKTGTGVRYSLGIGTREIANILAKCENAYKEFEGSEAERAEKIYQEIGSRDAINEAVNQLSPLYAEMSQANKGQFEALKDFIDFIKLQNGYGIMEVFDSAGRSAVEDDLTQRDFIDKVYKYGRFDQDRYLEERKAAQDRKLKAMDSVRSEMGKEIVPENPEKAGKIVTKRRATKLDVERFFNNGTLLARLMGLLNPMITVMSGVDKAANYTFDDLLLDMGEKGRGPYKSYAKPIELTKEAIEQFKSDPDIIDMFTAMQLARYNGDLETFIAKMNANEITPKQYLAEIEKQGSWVEKAFRRVAKIATAEFMFRGKRAENWLRFFAKMSADEGHTWLAQPHYLENGDSISELQWLITGPNKVQNLARFFYDPNMASDLTAQRALNLTLKADLAQDLALSVLIETAIKKNGVVNFGIAMTCTPFLKANIAFAHRALGHVMPCCTINYLLATGLGQSKRLQKLNPNIEAEMDRARLYSSLREAALVDVMNIGLPALAFIIASAAFLEPPDDDDKWCNWEEWTIMGYRLDTEWWINDILGVALPIACFWRSAELGKATPQILMRGLSQVMMENPLTDVGELVDMVFDPNGYMDSLEDSLEYYEDYPMGAPDGMEAVFATIPAIGLSWIGKLITPSLVRELSRIMPQYETSYNQIWEESETGALTAAGAEGKTQKTTFVDSRIRKVTKNNAWLGFLLDLMPIDTQTSYIGSKMPRQRIYDENQMSWMTEFSVVDEDGNYKSNEEQQQVVAEIILMLQSTDDMDALYHEGFYLNSQTREACSKYIWDMYHEITNQWETWRANGDLDFYVLGNGDFEAGSEKYGKMKLAYNQSRENLMSLYYDKLWSKELNQGLVVYNRYNTTWRQDINGNWYASGEQEKLGGLLSPLNKAPGTLDDPGITTGYENDWGTPSYVTGQSMYDENGNAMRALVPTVENELDVPSLDSWGEDRNNGYSSNYGTIYNTGTTSTSTDNGSTDNGTGSTSYPNRGTSSGRRYSSGGGGGGSSAPYSHVSAYGPNNNSIKQSAPNDGTRIYEANLDYLRPSFETKGSREAYRREDL